MPFLDLIDNVSIGRGAVVRLGPPDDFSDTQVFAQHALKLREIAFGPFLAVRDEADGLALERGRSRRGIRAGDCQLIGGIEHAKDHELAPARGSRVARMARPSCQLFGGSQSTHAPMAAVTALVLLPIQGGITAPKPPAGPPAATTRRSSGDASAV